MYTCVFVLFCFLVNLHSLLATWWALATMRNTHIWEDPVQAEL